LINKKELIKQKISQEKNINIIDIQKLRSIINTIIDTQIQLLQTAQEVAIPNQIVKTIGKRKLKN